MMRNSAATLLVASAGIVLGLAACGGSGSFSTPQNSQPGSLSGTVDSLVQTEMQQNGVPGLQSHWPRKARCYMRVGTA
jgi:hypothetical protein